MVDDGATVTAGTSDEGPPEGKVSFDEVYDRADPRAYFRTLAPLDYQTPEQARAAFSLLARTVRERASDDLRILDLCCSYGINAALLNHHVTLGDLYDRYLARDLDTMSADERVAADRAYYAARRRADAIPVVGLDVAANAVAYALRVGLLDAGRSENLEQSEPSAALARMLTGVGLIIVTGCISYITDATFDRLLGVLGGDHPPWVAGLSLRQVDTAPIAAVLARHGLRFEVLGGRTFRQRRFATDDERRHAFDQLERLGLDPAGVETDGHHHSTLFVARPRAQAVTPMAVLLAPAVASGAPTALPPVVVRVRRMMSHRVRRIVSVHPGVGCPV